MTLGGGPGGLSKKLDAKDIRRTETWTRRLIQQYQQMMGTRAK
jgi:hypothetical protein